MLPESVAARSPDVALRELLRMLEREATYFPPARPTAPPAALMAAPVYGPAGAPDGPPETEGEG